MSKLQRSLRACSYLSHSFSYWMNISTLKVETGGSEVQVRPQAHSASNASMCIHMRHCPWNKKMQTNLKRGSCNNKERHGCLRSQSETFEEAHHADILILYSDLNNYENKDCCSRHSSVLSSSSVRENLKISFSDFITIKNVKERGAAFYLPLFTLSTRGSQNSKTVNVVFVRIMHICY